MQEFNHSILQLLNDIKQEMLCQNLWQSLPPHSDAFKSDQPFALDMMSSYEWLQWIFLPRMHALIEANAVLPRNFALHPYFEEASKELEEEQVQELLSIIKRLDLLVKE